MRSGDGFETWILWLLASAIAANFLFPGEVNAWARWLIPTLCLPIAAGVGVVLALRREWYAPQLGLAAGVFLLLLALAAVSALLNQVNFARSRNVLLILSAYLVIYTAFRGSGAARQLRPLLWMIYVTSVLVSLYAIYQYFFLWDAMEKAAESLDGMSAFEQSALRWRLAGRRVFSVFALPTTLSGFLAGTFPVNVALLISTGTKPLRMVAVALPLIANLWALLLSQSFTGFLSLAFCVGMYYVTTEDVLAYVRRRWKPALVTALSFAAVFIFLLYVRQMIMVEVRAENPLMLRMVNWRIGLAAARDHWIVGVGPDNYQTVYTQYMREGEHQARHTHSAPIEMLAETGALGGGVFIVLIGLWFRSAWRILRQPRSGMPEPLGVALSVLALLFQNLLDIGIYFPSQGCLTFMLLGLMDGCLRRPQPAPVVPPAVTAPRLARVALAAVLLVAGIALARLGRELLLADLDYRDASSLHRENRDEEARRKLTSSLDRDPYPYEPYALLAEIELAARDAPSASLHLQRAISLSPYTASLHRVLAIAAAANGNALDAYRQSRRAAELFPASSLYARERDNFYRGLLSLMPEPAAPR
ncbi:MAG: O-antigen ligase family protein [Acidobacteriota bacterium]